MSELKFDDATQLTSALADAICERLEAAVAERGAASLVVSGGRTPLALFTELARRELPAAQIHITLADERWVDEESPDSNARMVREALLQGTLAEAHFSPLKNAAATPEAGIAATTEAIAALPQPFDVVLLGMGNDGHTASLFPQVSGDALSADCVDTLAAIQPLEAPHPRITLTLPALLNSHYIALHIEGAAKWDVYQQAQAGDEVHEMPVRGILHQRQTPVDIYWSA